MMLGLSSPVRGRGPDRGLRVSFRILKKSQNQKIEVHDTSSSLSA